MSFKPSIPWCHSTFYSYGTRDADNFVVKYEDTTRASFTIRYLAPEIWDSIQADIWGAEHIGNPKIGLKSMF